MIEVPVPTVPKWPFLLGDLLLLSVAGAMAWQLRSAAVVISPAYVGILVATVAAGAWLLCRPFLREHEAAARGAEQTNLANTLTQIRQLEAVGQQLTGAATQIAAAGQSLTRVEQTAQDLANQLSIERSELGKTLQHLNTQEQQATRLEMDKLRRAEEEALQVIVHLLDHTYALHQAGARSGQPGLVQQLGNFRMACLDAVRRLGLVALEAAPGEGFDPERHQTHDGLEAPVGAPIAGTFACGYSFRAALLRPIVVVTEAAAAAGGDSPIAGVGQPRDPLGLPI